MNKLGFMVLVAAAMTAVGCAEAGEVEGIEEQGETDSALAGNAKAETASLSVLGIQGTLPGTTNTFTCTGSLIAPRVVLTAAHCIDGSNGGKVYVGNSLAQATEQARIAKLIAHPQYDAKTITNDIGVLVLATPIRTVRPLAFNRVPLEQLVDVDDDVVIRQVGYGATSRDQAGATTGVGLKRSGLNLLADVRPKQFSVSAPGKNVAVACGGDSGGPAFVQTNRGWLIVGTESNGDRECKVGTWKMRTDAYATWIDAQIAANR